MVTKTPKTIKKPIPPIEGIIFDLDGTIIRTVVDFPKMKQRMIEYIQGLGISEIKYNTQLTTNEIISDLNQKMIDQGISDDGRNKIFVNISEILSEVEFENIDNVELLPGVREFISNHQADGIKFSILTRASHKYTIESLKRTGLKKFFDVIATRDDFTLLHAKPDLMALNYVIDKLDILPENVVFVGDHKIDFDCARAGKIRFVGVLTGAHNREMWQSLGCKILVEDFYELSELVRGNSI